MTKISKQQEQYIRENYTYNPKTGKILNLSNKEVGFISAQGYRLISTKGRTYQASRLAWFLHHGRWPLHNIDHIDGNPLNNRVHNLRDVPQGINMMNRNKFKNNKSGITGVHKEERGWRVRVSINGKKKCLGIYKDFFEACCARKSYENQREGFTERHGK